MDLSSDMGSIGGNIAESNRSVSDILDIGWEGGSYLQTETDFTHHRYYLLLQAMEISLVNSSCRNLQLSSSPFHHHHRFINGRNSPPPPPTRTTTTTTISFTKLNHFHNKSPSNPLFYGRSSTRVCTLGDTEIPGVATTTAVLESAQSLAMKNKAIDISPELKGTSIFLVGMKSSMKTNLAKVLADLLKYYYFDSDKLIEEAAGGESAAKNFRETDESGFRASETEVLKQLSSMGRLVVCAGDGAVESSTNLSFLRYGISIWIDVPLDMLAAEVIESQGPPSILDPSSEVVANLRKQYQEIKDGYATADALISVQKLAYKLGYEDIYSVTTEDMALETLKEMEKLTRVKKMMESASKPF